jgi:hypothetical protein
MSVIINGTTGISTDGGSDLFGTGTIGGSLTLTSGTANGVTYLNGSKVLTSGSALTFDGTNLANTLSANASAGIRVTNSNAGTTTSTNTSYSNGTNSHEFGILGTGYTTYGVLAAGDAYIYAGANKNISLMADGVGAIKFGTGAGGPEQMRLTSTGLGIGTSSPDYKLDVNGTSNFSGNMNLTATSNINWNGGDVAISNSGTNLVFKTYSGSLAERMRLDPSGNLGLGVTPSAWGSAFKVLQLANGTSLSNNGQTSYYQLGANNYFDGTDYKYIASNYAGFHRFSNVGAYEWYTAPSGTAGGTISFTQAMTLTADGNLGVGTSSPAVKLDFGSTTNGTQIVNLRKNNNSIAGLGVNAEYGVRIAGPSDAAAPVSFGEISISDGTTFSEFMRIDSAGNVGIGTTSPSAKLQVDSSSATYSANIRVRNSNFGNGVVGAASGILTVATDMNNIAFYTGSNLGVDGTSVPTNERMRIDSSGNVGIGTSSPDVALDVVGEAIIGNGTYGVKLSYSVGDTAGIIDTGNSANKLSFRIGNSEKARIESGGSLLMTTARSTARGRVDIPDTGGTQSVPLAISRGGDAGTMVNFFSTNSTTTTIGSISNSGNTSTSYNTSSDYRLKEDWVAVADASTRVNALKPVNFAWIASGERVDGFLAHELAEVVPEAVTGEKDAVDAKGNPVYQGIDQSKLVPLLTAALQEALARIESLEADVATLKGAA